MSIRSRALRRATAGARFVPLCLLVLLALLMASAVRAEETLRFELEFFEHGEAQPILEATIWSAGRRVRIEQRSPGAVDPGAALLFRGDRDRLYGISDRTRSYVDVERDLLARLSESHRRARHEASSQLAGLPSDQRKALERMLGVSRQEVDRIEEPVVVTRSGVRDEFSGFACERVALHRAERLLGEACIASWEQIGLEPSDFEVFRVLANFQRDAMGTPGNTPLELVPDQPLDLISQFDGLPLRFERRVDGRPRSAILLRRVTREAYDADRFEPPPAYVRRTGPSALMALAAMARPEPPGASPSAAESPAPPGPASPAWTGDDEEETLASGAASAPASRRTRPARPARRYAPPPGASIRLFP
ncbi:MAG: hypothetical protein H6748_14705 [Spirochaetaceae bacterium]|nr:hypothetical protein [Myxococcales bacterium]MCB9725299.1 hypothetical protein [Spirochaetaceae bacterium]